jgi:two-component system OmpR family response regulator
MKLLVVDDDLAIAAALAHALATAGYSVDCAHAWRGGLTLAMTERYALILLDRMLPEVDGIAIARILRASGLATPVLLLTGPGVDHRAEECDLGGAHRLVEPYTNSQLLARVAALARLPPVRVEPAILRVDDLELDLPMRAVVRAGQPIPLRPREFQLLECLVRNAGRVVTHAMLREDVFGLDLGPTTSSMMATVVGRLRAKMDRGFAVELIHTVPGVGYCLLNED